MSEQLFDVLAVNLETHEERVLTTGLDAKNAEAYIKFAVFRRGVEDEFYKSVPSANPSEQSK